MKMFVQQSWGIWPDFQGNSGESLSFGQVRQRVEHPRTLLNLEQQLLAAGAVQKFSIIDAKSPSFGGGVRLAECGVSRRITDVQQHIQTL